jgi:cytosol alanyl aminopeptidase
MRRVLGSLALACALALSLAACGAEPTTGPGPLAVPTTPPETPDPPPPPREDGRLPSAVRPLHYDVALDVDPRKERFHGIVTIALEVRERTFHVVVHGRDLAIARASAAVAGATLPATATARVASGGAAPEEIELSFARPLPAGAAVTLTMEYDAPFGSDLTGLYRVKSGDAWYAYSDFEPTDARKMLPCFDEPALKAPFDVKVTVPKGMIAVSNAKESTRTPGEGGSVAFVFAPTKPLPTYLLALAVGDFDVREGATTPVPIRVIAPKGKGDMAQLALDAGAGITQVLEGYLKVKFPFPKLDLVAVPEFASGAMENAGLITFREELLLADTRRASTRSRRGLATVIAHEIAHQWFGDMVTAEWWNDLWLNEAMATWLTARTVHAWQPQLGTRYDLVTGGLSVMDHDGLASARAVRQPVRTAAEALEAFDGITYTKGAAILAMLEDWVGAEAFQSALHDYLEAFAYKNATASSLLSTLDRTSHKNVSEVAGTFLDRAGVPLVTAHLECEPGRWHVELQQEAWRPLGTTAEDTQQTWSHPICVRAEGRKEPVCTLLAGGAPSLVAGTGRCPAWVLPNPGATGYFRVTEPGPDLAALARAVPGQDAADRVAFVSNAWAAVRGGALGPEQLLKILPAFDKDNERIVVEAVIGALGGMNDNVVDDDARAQFRAYAAARLGRQKTSLGFSAVSKDGAKEGVKDGAKVEEERTLLRRTVLFAMADLAGDAATIREADVFAQAWLKDPLSVEPDVAQIAVELASRTATEERLTALREAAKKAKTQQDRIVAIRAMAGFDEPAILERALDVYLTDEIKPAEGNYLLRTAAGRRAARPVLARWVESRWDKLRAKLPGQLSRGLVFAAGLSCTRAERDAAAAFFGPRVAGIEGAARPLAAALESASLCAELRTRASAATSKALRAKMAAP